MVVSIFDQDAILIAKVKMSIMPRIGEEIWTTINGEAVTCKVTSISYFISETMKIHESTHIYCDVKVDE